ncbi:hypothetical protein MY10362_006909 [Beauveria mimosiformis]
MQATPSLRHLLSILAFMKLCAACGPGQWAPPRHDDFRGPCPMMNTLANHGYIPRDGRNITKHNAIIGLGNGLNFGAELASLMWDQAIVANPEPNATFFTLRTDAYFNSNQVFNKTIFDGTKTWWTDESLSPLILANSKLARQLESRRDNPEYKFTASTEDFSLGELAAPVIAFGNLGNGEVSRALFTYFFENERLPVELGWRQRNTTITLTDIMNTVALIRNATNLLTPSDASQSPARNVQGGLQNRFHF